MPVTDDVVIRLPRAVYEDLVREAKRVWTDDYEENYPIAINCGGVDSFGYGEIQGSAAMAATILQFEEPCE